MTQPASPAATPTTDRASEKAGGQADDRTATGGRVRDAAIGALFAAVLLIPKILHVRRNEHSWMLFRIFLGLAGAALVVVPLGVWNNWILSIVGLVMFLAAALLPPAKQEPSVDAKARELGAFVVLNGGTLHAKNVRANNTRIFLGPETLFVLGADFQPLLSIPVAEVRYVRAVPHEGRWFLQVDWADHSADFSYRGFFAEHLARVAESSLNSVRPAQLPILQSTEEQARGRAAGA